MNKKHIILGFLFVLCIVLLAGCKPGNEQAKSYVVEQGASVATKHFREVRHEDVLFNEHTFESEGVDSLHLYGYVKDNPSKKREIVLSYNEGFSIIVID